MPLPGWIRTRLVTSGAPTPDVWRGQTLQQRSEIRDEELHYRIYDDRTGELLSFNSTNDLNILAVDIVAVRDEHPGARLRIVRFDGTA